MTMNIIISLVGGAAIMFCLYLLANNYDIFAAPLGLAFLAFYVVIGKITDTITGRNGFQGGLLLLAPQTHEMALIPTILVIWLIFSGLIFCSIWIARNYFYS